jgi:mannose-6-phosphate isomerase-like protein (cupin superfamily)
MADEKPIPTASRRLAVSLPRERPNFGVGADTYSIVMTGQETNGAYAFIDMHIPPGGGPVPHAHACEEMFYVVEGEVEVFCHDQRLSAGASAAVNIPGWAPHMFRNLATVPARLFAVVSPAGLEAQFAEMGAKLATRTTPPPPPSAAELEEMMRKLPGIAARYDARILPPDTFDHLLSAEELRSMKAAEGR